MEGSSDEITPSFPCIECRRISEKCLLASGEPERCCINCVETGQDCSFLLVDGAQNIRVWKRKRDDNESRENEVEQRMTPLHNEGVDRGRTRRRAASPVHYAENERTRSQSPAVSFYHGDSPARASTPVNIKHGIFSMREIETQPYIDRSVTKAVKIPKLSSNSNPPCNYRYTPLANNEVRLLRIAPGSFGEELCCSLKTVSLERLTTVVHEFQALSYAWGDGYPDQLIYLNELSRTNEDAHTTNPMMYHAHSVRRNLHQALKHIRLTNDFLWVWVDALCIDQRNYNERSQQIPLMPDIYSNAWNVIAWLGEDGPMEGDIAGVVDFIPELLNLKTLDVVLGDEAPSDDALRSWVSFGRLLQRPWFERRWVIQEVACARRLSVRIGRNILSWLDFADAVDLYLAKIDRLRELYSHSVFYETSPFALDGIEGSKAVALLKFSNSVFRKTSDSVIMSRLMSLESLVLTASSFAVSDPRDIVYALLYLANDRHDVMSNSHVSPTDFSLTSDYTKHAADTFLHFTRYCIAKSQSLDIICRRWAYWPRPHRYSQYDKRFLPTWIGIASYVGARHHRRSTTEDLVGPVGSQIYNASRGVTFRAQTLFPTFKHVIQAEGVVLGTIKRASAVISRGTLHKHCIRMLGWDGTLNDGVDDKIWRTLVANRSADGKTAPTWYRRACALSLTKISANGLLNISDLIADKSQPSTMIDYLKRVRSATQSRKIFHCTSVHMTADTRASFGLEETVVGLGPENLECHDEDLVCILFGCSVPVVLRHCSFYGTGTRHAFFVGACYVHGHMEGEMFAGMSTEEVRRKATTLNIY